MPFKIPYGPNSVKILIILLYIMTLSLWVDESEACGFPTPSTGGGGGGCACGGYGGCGGCGGGCGGCGGGCGGCGGGCGGCGGCCGRKKRSLLEQQLKTESSNACPQSAWNETITRNLGDDAISTQHAIQASMLSDFGTGKFLVSCAQRNANTSKDDFSKDNQQTPPMTFLSNGESFCSVGNEKMFCTVVALMA
ncbi:hypothetical protein DdX_08491 [Ditylenchus destructor]|uniref:Ground-like domain-containing protein n=1 Tax=Ditylenchus destructor TaxID=166010 RepID=A0AAD4R7A0_9BILA|nr:hypothetical protein DdX_08491 [Ditylenchus destructor]